MLILAPFYVILDNLERFCFAKLEVEINISKFYFHFFKIFVAYGNLLYFTVNQNIAIIATE